MPGDPFFRTVGTTGSIADSVRWAVVHLYVAAEVAVVRRVLSINVEGNAEPHRASGVVARKQAWQESNLQPPVLEPTPGNAGVDTNPGTVRVSDWTEVTADRTNAAFPSSLTAPSRVPSMLGQGPRDRVVPRERHCARTWSEGRFPPAQLG
jgi:hypothetical protein